MPSNNPKNLLRGLASRPVFKGLGVEMARTAITNLFLGVSLAVLTFVFTGVINLSWSLRSFNLFGAINVVEAPNEQLSTESVYQIPLNLSVRLNNGVFLALAKPYSNNAIYATLTASTGQSERQRISPSSPLFETFGCDRIGVQLMETYQPDENSVLILYTIDRINSEECRSRLGRLLRSG